MDLDQIILKVSIIPLKIKLTLQGGGGSKVKPCFWILHTEQRSVGLVNTGKKTSCGYSKEVDCELPGRDSQKPAAEV